MIECNCAPRWAVLKMLISTRRRGCTHVELGGVGGPGGELDPLVTTLL